MIRIISRKNKKLVCNNCEKLETLSSQFIGLMFCKERKKSLLFVFEEEKEHPIHSFFVPYEFSAIYLDKNMRVTDVFRIKPYELYVSNKKPAKYLVESFNLNYIPKIGEELECTEK